MIDSNNKPWVLNENLFIREKTRRDPVGISKAKCGVKDKKANYANKIMKK